MRGAAFAFLSGGNLTESRCKASRSSRASCKCISLSRAARSTGTESTQSYEVPEFRKKGTGEISRRRKLRRAARKIISRKIVNRDQEFYYVVPTATRSRRTFFPYCRVLRCRFLRNNPLLYVPFSTAHTCMVQERG